MHLLLSTLFCLGFACCVKAQDKPGVPAKPADEPGARIRKILSETIIENGDVTEVSFAEALKTLEAALPKEKKLSLRLDEKGFGKDLSRIAGVKLLFPMGKLSLQKALNSIVRELPDDLEAEAGIESNGIVITRARLLGQAINYSSRGLVEELPARLPDLQKRFEDIFGEFEGTDGAALLMRWLMKNVELRSWESVRVMNGVRLVVFASPSKQQEINELVNWLRRLCDLNVVMNARLYEVDRAFYIKHIAPLVAADKDSEEPKGILAVDGLLFKQLARQKLVLQSEELKIRPNRKEPFLSYQDVVRFNAGSKPGKDKRAPVGTALPGVSFEVCPVVSLDRRFLRLHISQHGTHFVGIGKLKIVDPATGKDVEVESPNLRRSTANGTIQLADGAPFVMPVTYRPQGRENEDKVWLLVARPYVWIQQEADEVRKGGGEVTSKSVWESDVPKDVAAVRVKPSKPLPDNDEVREILQALVTDVLTNPTLKDPREDYGSSKDRTFTLVDDESLGWPKHFKPDTHGHKLVEVTPDPFNERRRILGIRIDKFDLKQKTSGLFDTPIEIVLFNAGGTANGAIAGGCRVYYVTKRVGKRWVVQWEFLRS